MGLKHRDAHMTSYALCVGVVEMLHSTLAEYDLTTTKGCIVHHININIHIFPHKDVKGNTKNERFYSSIDISPIDTCDNDIDEMDSVIM